MRILTALLILALLATPAAALKRKKKRRAPKPPPVFTVTPSRDIEQRVETESARAKAILVGLNRSNVFDSPYLSEALYYHDGFLADFPDERPDADPARRIVARLEREMTSARKAAYVQLLTQYWCETAPDPDAPPAAFVVPVRYELPAPPPKPRKHSRWRRRARATNHEFAVDLFTNEGTAVRSATRGVVILADKDWAPGEAFSTTSQKGGNSVIVFDPDGERFLRYAHLDQVSVVLGGIVHAGDTLGTVGHTGLNASRPRHGRHVHFEVNEIEGGKTHALRSAELWALIHAGEQRRIDAP